MNTPVPPPPPLQPPSLAAPSPGPSRKWYLTAILLVVLIGVPSVIAFTSGLRGITEGLIRMKVPGEATIDLEPGTWTVFYEHSGEFEGETFLSSRAAPGMNMSVTTSDGEPVTVTPSNASFNYNVGGHSGYSIGRFRTDHDGEHDVSVTLADPDDPESYLVAFGRDLERSTVQLVLGIVGMLAAGGLAFIVWLVVFVLRYRAKRRVEASSFAPGS